MKKVPGSGSQKGIDKDVIDKEGYYAEVAGADNGPAFDFTALERHGGSVSELLREERFKQARELYEQVSAFLKMKDEPTMRRLIIEAIAKAAREGIKKYRKSLAEKQKYGYKEEVDPQWISYEDIPFDDIRVELEKIPGIKIPERKKSLDIKDTDY